MWSPRTWSSPERDEDARVHAEDILGNLSERWNESVMLRHLYQSLQWSKVRVYSTGIGKNTTKCQLV